MIGLDTTFVIDFLNGEESAINLVENYNEESFIVTPVTIFEVFLGILAGKNNVEHRENAAREFFDRAQVVSISQKTAVSAARIAADTLKNGNVTEIADAMIAAALLEYGCNKILTRDKDFTRIKGINTVLY